MYIEGQVIEKVTDHTSMVNDKRSTNRRSFSFTYVLFLRSFDPIAGQVVRMNGARVYE